MPDNTASPLIVTRTIEPWSNVIVELRVPRSTAEQWFPEFRNNDRLLSAWADDNAHRLVLKARAGRLGAGRWRATFAGGDRVEIEARV
jgi:hypothetical protein